MSALRLPVLDQETRGFRLTITVDGQLLYIEPRALPPTIIAAIARALLKGKQVEVVVQPTGHDGAVLTEEGTGR